MQPAPAHLDLHPAIAAWFSARFPEGPTEAQAKGWPLVRAGSDVLIAAPTGSGKTLAGFLMAIDQAYRAHEAGEDLQGKTRVAYVSPLKALAVDVQQNLERPLAEIAKAAEELGLAVPPHHGRGAHRGHQLRAPAPQWSRTRPRSWSRRPRACTCT